LTTPEQWLELVNIMLFSLFNTALIAKKYSKVQGGSLVAVVEGRSQSQTIPFETVRGYIATFIHRDHHLPFVFPSQPNKLILPVSLIWSVQVKFNIIL
jgi:hypothetical protein